MGTSVICGSIRSSGLVVQPALPAQKRSPTDVTKGMAPTKEDTVVPPGDCKASVAMIKANIA